MSIPITYNEFRERVQNDIVNGEWIYRGQSSVDWGLNSSYFRFCKRNNLKFSLNSFHALLRNFIYQVSEYLTKEHGQMNLTQQIAFAQHHGLFTPFLDWTLSPYIATYFALSNQTESQVSDRPFRIWAINVKEFKQTDFGEPVDNSFFIDDKVKFKYIETQVFYSRRIARQLGCFTFLNFQEDLDKIFNKHNLDLKWYDINGNRLEILKELRIMGITGGTMFDSIDNISNDIMSEFLLRNK